ncbi:MAG TPA: tryptophan synthase subunit alpha [Polyangiales bacterium]|jgi:tryptophan synthase alpha chain|nr:tryptophan synthase subunit alpha [Polyangiales bacterium]
MSAVAGQGNRLARAFERARGEKRAALVIYLCAGDPDLPTSVRLMKAIARAGADVIEVGVPFSDPTADGVVIQRASERALAAGTTLLGVLDAVAELRRESDVPVVLFGYYNPILAHGEAVVAERAAKAGVDGFLVVDLPPEEASGFHAQIQAKGMSLVPLVAPTTSDARLALVTRFADAFVYYVSLTGVTGAATDLAAAAKRAEEVRAHVKRPVAVGFGVKTPDDARAVAARADGVVVGSAICSLIAAANGGDDAVAKVSALVASLRAACVR